MNRMVENYLRFNCNYHQNHWDELHINSDFAYSSAVRDIYVRHHLKHISVGVLSLHSSLLQAKVIPTNLLLSLRKGLNQLSKM